MPEEMMQYSGYYGNFGGVMRVDITHDGQLLITIPNRSDYSESYVYIVLTALTNTQAVKKRWSF